MTKKGLDLTAKEKKVLKMEKEELDRSLRDEIDRMHLIPEPTRICSVGESIKRGFLENVKVEDVLMKGKIYLISFGGEDKRQKRYVNWLDVVKRTDNKESFIQNQDLNFSYSQRTMGDIFRKAYYFGIDFAPDYQRDYVWAKKDKVELVDSIFRNIDIGKFVFIKYSEEKEEALKYRYGYEILDGKQRIRAILDFNEDRFRYKGKLKSELSSKDQHHFDNYSINIAELRDITKEQALRYFISLNKTGKKMDKKHLKTVEDKLATMLDSKGES